MLFDICDYNFTKRHELHAQLVTARLENQMFQLDTNYTYNFISLRQYFCVKIATLRYKTQVMGISYKFTLNRSAIKF